MAPRPLHVIDLCSGYGGFALALRAAGLDARTVCHVELETHAAATLVARMEDQALDPAPVWDDLRSFDGAAWRGRVDLVTAGFPCQPFSQAGSKRGITDDRWLWPAIARVIADVDPSYVFVENVRGVVNAGLAVILDDLADLGFDAEWGLLSAAEVGAPHQRERFWLLAAQREPVGDPGGTRHGQIGRGAPREQGEAGWRPQGAGVADGAGEAVADPHHEGREPLGHGGGQVELDPDRCGSAPVGSWPPPRDDTDGWRRWIDAGGAEPAVRRSADGPAGGLAQSLFLGGNGIVPAVGAAALLELAERLDVDLTPYRKDPR